MDRGEVFERWRTKYESARVRNIVCLGDSITYAPSMPRIGVTRNWVAQLSEALETSSQTIAGDGFRGLWRHDEWTTRGEWTKTKASDAFDVVPFGFGLFSSSIDVDKLTWQKPHDVVVGAFDLFWFQIPGTGGWQYRVDRGRWRVVGETADAADNRLHRVSIGTSVDRTLEIRGYDGARPCVAPIAGVATYRSPAARNGGIAVHNLGHQEQLLQVFCRASTGDPLAFLDNVQPELVIVFFSNDVRLHNAAEYEKKLRDLIGRVADYGDVLIVSPFEQRPTRSIADARTKAGSRVLNSSEALFFASDAGCPLTGTNLSPQTRIEQVESPTQVLMSEPAAASSAKSVVSIESVRDIDVQAEYRAATAAVAEQSGCAHLDLYAQWREAFGGGWESAYNAGFMHDALHPTQRGHDDIAARVCALLGLRIT